MKESQESLIICAVWAQSYMHHVHFVMDCCLCHQMYVLICLIFPDSTLAVIAVGDLNLVPKLQLCVLWVQEIKISSAKKTFPYFIFLINQLSLPFSLIDS